MSQTILTDIKCKIVAHDSDAYWDTVKLRREILRKPLNLDFTPEQLAAENTDFHLTAWYGPILTACLIMTSVDSETMKMRQVAVRQDVQGRGVGKALVKFTEDFAMKRGIKRIVLHARDTAVPFYLAQAYSIYDEPFEEVGIPHRKMVKTIYPNNDSGI